MTTLPQAATPGPARPVAWRRLAPWLLLAAVALAYADSLSAPFLFDDLAAINENPTIRQWWAWPGPWRTPPGSAACGRPVVNVTLALNYAWSGLHPASYRTVNIGLHVLAAWLVFGLVRRTLSGPRLGSRFGDDADGLALTAALLWAVHPLQTSTVTYVIQRTELLMGLFLLATLYCFVRGVETGLRPWWLVAAVACCALGMGSKEVMVVAPLLVLLYDRTFLADSFRDAWRRRWPWHVALAATWIALASLVLSTSVGVKTGVGFASLTPWRYALTQAGVILHYVRLSLWPHPLVLDYLDWPPAVLSPALVGAVAIVVAALATTVVGLGRRRPWAFLGAWFFLILAPTSSFLPLHGEVVAERRMYLPLAAVVMTALLGWSWVRRWLAERGGQGQGIGPMVGWGLAAGLALAGIGLTAWRNLDYRSEVTIWSDTVARRPGNYRAHTDLGAALAEENRLDEAIVCYREALRLAPTYAVAHANLGIALAQQGNLSEALREFVSAVQLRPDSAKAHYNLGLALAKLGEPERAVWHWQQALRLDPHFDPARARLRERNAAATEPSRSRK